MSATVSGRRIYRLSSFRLDSCRKFMERNGNVLPLGPRVIDTLTVLVESAGEVVDKETLLRLVWPDTAVVESSLTKNICILRKVLDEGQEGPSAIQTVSRRGYRFVGQIEEEPESQAPSEPPPSAPAPGRLRSRPFVAAAAAVAVVAVAVGLASIRLPDGRQHQEGLTDSDREYLVGRHIWSKMTCGSTRAGSNPTARCAA